ncbi:MAG: glycosyltransferase family 39 protein [Caldilineaceae bacterium]
MVIVWAIVRLATAMSGRTVGLVTGILVALSPLLTWYSQELRMFQPATTGLTVGALCLWRAWTAPNRTRQYLWWAGYLVATTAALYSHLFSALLLPAAGLMLLLLPWQASQPQRWSRFHRHRRHCGTGCSFCPWPTTPGWSTAAKVIPALLLPIWVRISGICCAFLPSGVSCRRPMFGQCWPFCTSHRWGLLLPKSRGSSSPPAVGCCSGSAFPRLSGMCCKVAAPSVFGEDRYFLFVPLCCGPPRAVVLLGAYWRPLGWFATVSAVGIMAAALTNLWTPAMYR